MLSWWKELQLTLHPDVFWAWTSADYVAYLPQHYANITCLFTSKLTKSKRIFVNYIKKKKNPTEKNKNRIIFTTSWVSDRTCLWFSKVCYHQWVCEYCLCPNCFICDYAFWCDISWEMGFYSRLQNWKFPLTTWDSTLLVDVFTCPYRERSTDLIPVYMFISLVMVLFLSELKMFWCYRI